MNTKTTKRSLCVLIVAALCWEANVLPAQVADNEQLINITTLEQLDAIRHDLDGDGVPTNDPATTLVEEAALYRTAFGLSSVENNTCTGECKGYELMNDLDFNDTEPSSNGKQLSKWSKYAAAPSTYPGGGATFSGSAVDGGWEPIGTTSWVPFGANFDGNHHMISNLYINRSEGWVGLFGVIGNGIEVCNLGLVGGSVSSVISTPPAGGSGSSDTMYVGSLAGQSGIVTLSTTRSVIRSCYATVNVMASGLSQFFGATAGGLVGANYANIKACYATGNVSATSNASAAYAGGLVGESASIFMHCQIVACYATGDVQAYSTGLLGFSSAGGLVGSAPNTSIMACYATGNAHASRRGPATYQAGGLVGKGRANITSCYAIGKASISPGLDSIKRYALGGLIGFLRRGKVVDGPGSVAIQYSYFDLSLPDRPTRGRGLTYKERLNGTSLDIGKTTAQLQSPTAPVDIYANWNIDIDGNTTSSAEESLWNFGTSSEYPALQLDFNNDGTVSVAEFGAQGRGATRQEAPVFESSGTYSFTVAENAAFSQTVVASNPSGATLSYSLSTTTTEARGWFQINADGLITNAEMIDYEALGMSKVLRLTITATAGGESTEQEVTITVTDVPAPVFESSGTYSFTVAENAAFSQTVVASNPSGATLSYSLSTRTTEADGWFQINADGLITNAQTIDYEALGTSKEVTLTITATAGGESTTQEVTITVTDVDENAAPAPFGVANRGDEGPRFYPNPAVSSLYVSGLEMGVHTAIPYLHCSVRGPWWAICLLVA